MKRLCKGLMVSVLMVGCVSTLGTTLNGSVPGRVDAGPAIMADGNIPGPGDGGSSAMAADGNIPGPGDGSPFVFLAVDGNIPGPGDGV